MSRIEDDIYFEIEILCDGIKENIGQLKKKKSEVLVNTYIHQCMFLVEEVLEYVRLQRRTTVYFVHEADDSTCDTCTLLHLNEVTHSQKGIKDAIKSFKEAVAFIFPGDSYPDYLFSLKAKMSFVDIYMTDLFYLEQTKVSPRPTELPHALTFEVNVMN